MEQENEKIEKRRALLRNMKAMVRDPGKGVRVVRIERWEKGKLEWCRYATIFIEVIFEG
jgi:hypothetical protein